MQPKIHIRYSPGPGGFVSALFYFELGADIYGWYCDAQEHRFSAAFFMLENFYAANAPWLIGHGWMVWDAARAINRRFQNASVEASRGSEWADVNEVRPAS